MFDTDITIVGTVLSQPEGRRTTTNALVVTFRVVSNARKFDRTNGVWVDKSHLRLKVNCWRKLGESVLASVNVGDPVILKGSLQTQDWKTEDGEPRMTYELDAFAVGHDLARGRGTFARNRGEHAITVEDDDERTGPRPALGSAVGDEEDAATDMDAVAILRGAGLVPSFGSDGGGFLGGGSDATEDADPDGDQDEDESADAGPGGSGGRGRRRGRTPVPA